MNENIFAINNAASRIFEAALEDRQGMKAKEYILERGIPEKSVSQFRLGYSVPDIEKRLKEAGFSGDDLVDSGLFGKNDCGTLWFRFPRRLTLPIRDAAGNILGFGARILGQGNPKYLNTPETEVFRKRSLLYGLKPHKKNFVVVCEGYMDVIALHEIGFNNAVATLGTSLTESHAELIAGISQNVVLMYDMDKAGRTATEKAFATLRSKGLNVYVADLSPAKDPDEFIRHCQEEPREAVIERVKKSFPAIEFLLEKMAVKEDGERDFKKAADILLRNCSAQEALVIAKRVSKRQDNP